MKQLSEGEDAVIRSYVSKNEDEFDVIDSIEPEFDKLEPYSPTGTENSTVFDDSGYYVIFGDVAFYVPKKKYETVISLV